MGSDEQRGEDSERSRSCAQQLQALRARARGERAAQDVAASTAWRGGGPEPPIVTREDALRGKAGLDYMPDMTCEVCGRVPYWNGRRIVPDHDGGKHGVADGAVVEYNPRNRQPSRVDANALVGHQRARRSAGERDDD